MLLIGDVLLDVIMIAKGVNVPWKVVVGFACVYLLHYVLWYAVWRGYRWAVILFVVLGFLSVFAAGPLSLLTPSGVVAIVMNVATSSVLMLSPSVRAFLVHQRVQREA